MLVAQNVGMMVAQNAMRTCEGTHIFILNLTTAGEVIKCLKNRSNYLDYSACAQLSYNVSNRI